ncbi:hypothetical protein FQN55_004193 [Onygenales sp. PD_40]|nr:hypothetical protein FQN55_004193 [Onygenales sp. PD_40]KAK2802050.1 hypothetical protein FQN51_004960 [Onygenales sp. PD_10]
MAIAPYYNANFLPPPLPSPPPPPPPYQQRRGRRANKKTKFKATSQTEGTGRNLRPLTAIQEARKVELEELLEEAKEKAQGLKAQKRKVERDIAEAKGEISELVRELVSLRRE